MRFVDTNIFLYKMLGRPFDRYERCSLLIDRLASGTEISATSLIVVAEIIWVLSSVKGWAKADVRGKIGALCSLPGLRIVRGIDERDVSEAVRIYEELSVDFEDALNAILMKKNGIPEIYSFDRHFDRIPFLKRVIP